MTRYDIFIYNKTKIAVKKTLSIIFSAIILLVGSYLIIKDFHKEQIKIWDEGSSAKNSVDMYANNNFIVQYDDGEPVRDDFKPPLNLWTKMICYHFFGINEFSVRLTSIIAALLTMFVLWYFGFFVLKRPELGIIFPLLLISSRGYVYYHVARTGDPDSLLVFFITLSMLFLFQLIQKYPVKKLKYISFLGLSVLMAMYTKGSMGFIPLAGFGVYALLNRNGRRVLSDLHFYYMCIITLALISAYYLLREYFDPGFFRGVLGIELFSFTKSESGYVKHPEFTFYFNYLLTHGFKPFMYLFPIPLIVYFVSGDTIIRKLISYTFLGISIFLLGMSAAALKNEWYIASVYPYLAIYTGAGLIGLKDILATKYFPNYKLIVNIIFVVAVALLCIFPILKINKANQSYKQSIYYFEREGRFFDYVKKSYPETKKIGVIIPHHSRQLKFYTKKHNYLDGTNTTIYKNVPDTLSNDTIIACQKDVISELSEKFYYDTIDTDEYCKLIKIENH